MLKLWLLKRFLKRLDNPVLWLSGGKDSRLLLEIMLAERIAFSVLRFPTGWSREQRRVVDRLILEHQLRVYSYPPSNGVMVGNYSGDIALISTFAVGNDGETLDLVSDIIPGKKCAFDIEIGKWPFQNAPITFGVHILGAKKNETHFVNNGIPFWRKREYQVGGAALAAPLFSWSDADVVKTLRKYGVEWTGPSDEANGGNIAACTLCLQSKCDPDGMVKCPKTGEMIPLVKWSPLEKLELYQRAAGIVR